jgi:cobalt-precorrin-5B (C1)-methyltransferase
MLITQSLVESVSLMTPKGVMLELAVLNTEIKEDFASCAIQKDSGDDPDVTNGLLVFAKVRAKISKSDTGIRIFGGKGVGTVTQKGLDQPVGESAINSVPRTMITEAVAEIAEKHGYRGGFDVEISVPQGEEIALKTFNSRLGIKGGISIIGTSGIVEPMSNSAIVETIRAEQNIRRANGVKNLVLTLGDYSNKFVSKKNYTPVTCGNFIGESIDIALESGFESILVAGHIGKLVKLGAGIMNTHSSEADGRLETLITCGVLAGFGNTVLKSIAECITVDSALELMREHNESLMYKSLDILAERVQYYLDLRVRNAARIGAVMFSEKSDILIKTSGAEQLW